MPTPNKIHNDKTLLIAKRLKRIRKAILSLEKRLNIRMRILLSSLKTDNGIVTGDNLSFLSKVDKEYQRFLKNEHAKIVNTFAKDLLTIGDKNVEYFNEITKVSPSTKDRLKNKQLRILGIEGNKVKKGGFLDLFSKDNTIATQIKRDVILSMQSGSTLPELRKTVSERLISNKKGEGLLKRYWRQNAFDTYSGFDAAISVELADEYGVQAFLYTDTRERDSRHFCVHSHGNVYLTEESQDWKNLVNKKRGKTVIGPIMARGASYNPRIHRGGINCKHNLRPITNAEALRRDKTLTEVNGNLKRKEGKNPNTGL